MTLMKDLKMGRVYRAVDQLGLYPQREVEGLFSNYIKDGELLLVLSDVGVVTSKFYPEGLDVVHVLGPRAHGWLRTMIGSTIERFTEEVPVS